jgi:5-methylphenazine-1-carboxylate 1-monooxygenase
MDTCCSVFEAATEVKGRGVGTNTLPNAIRELASLGLLPDLDHIAYGRASCAT